MHHLGVGEGGLGARGGAQDCGHCVIVLTPVVLLLFVLRRGCSRWSLVPECESCGADRNVGRSQE